MIPALHVISSHKASHTVLVRKQHSMGGFLLAERQSQGQILHLADLPLQLL